jgi:hypothetical protein
MKHYRCQNVYITATASERIVSTLEIFPHNSPMPQMSSTDRILMADRDMTDALKHPHRDVPFSTIGEDTMSALTTLAEIFTRKLKKPEATNGPPALQKTAANKRQNSQPQPEITSPIKQNHQQTSRTNVNQALENVQQPPRVVTPATRPAAPPRVQARTHQLSPRNLSQDFLDIGGANCAIAFGENHWTNTPMMNAVIHPVTGKEMQ